MLIDSSGNFSRIFPSSTKSHKYWHNILTPKSLIKHINKDSQISPHIGYSVSKTVEPYGFPGFESLSLRQNWHVVH
jgi:hypothetical protein